MACIQIIRYILCIMILSVAYTYAFSLFTGKKITPLRYSVCAVANLLAQFTNFLLLGSKTELQVVFSVIALTFVGVYVYKLHGYKLLMSLATLLLCCFISDAVTGTIMVSILGTEKVNSIVNGFSPLYYLMNAICALLIICTSAFCNTLRNKLEKLDIENATRLIRSCCLILIIIYLYYNAIAQTDFNHRSDTFWQAFPRICVVSLLLLISLSYIIQDVRYVRQKVMNSALLEQKKIQDAMLQDTRIFRHNIANLLYGFQGSIMNGNTDSIRQYYEQMTSACRIINNENVLALQRIPSIPVHTLLMEKITSANEQKIPFYVYTDENLIWRGFKDSEMCEVLGVLVDNALEATKGSSAPLVTLEFHNAENDMEVVVRNTCQDIENALGQSTKPGHEGLGLTSLRGILSKHTNALFNLFTQGRFVEAHLLMR